MKSHYSELVCVLVLISLTRPVLAQAPQFTGSQLLTNRELRLLLNVPASQHYRLETTTNLSDWAALLTTRSLGANQHTDSAAPYQITRYYRATQLANTNDLVGDHLQTTNGDVVIHPRYHASTVLGWNGLTIYVDPDDATNYAGLPKADLILVTHEHGDHFSAPTMELVRKTNTVIITTQTVYGQANMTTALRNLTTVQTNGAVTNVLGLTIESVRAYNTNSNNHQIGIGNGYVLNIAGRRLYFSGDTSSTPEMANLQNIDVAFICMNSFTMTINEAAAIVRTFRPRIVYPYHHSQGNMALFKQLVGTDLGIEVRLRRWY